MKSGKILPGRGPFEIRGAEAAALLVALNAATFAVLAMCALGSAPAPAARNEIIHRIDVLSAPEGELALLPGVGPARASRIASLRDGFDSLSPVEILVLSGMTRTEAEGLSRLVAAGGGESR